jgi:hypothetical protein
MNDGCPRSLGTLAYEGVILDGYSGFAAKHTRRKFGMTGNFAMQEDRDGSKDRVQTLEECS